MNDSNFNEWTYLSFKEIKKKASQMTNHVVKCKCGHTVNLGRLDRMICTWCNKWVYLNPKVEFRYRLKEEMRK